MSAELTNWGKFVMAGLSNEEVRDYIAKVNARAMSEVYYGESATVDLREKEEVAKMADVKVNMQLAPEVMEQVVRQVTNQLASTSHVGASFDESMLAIQNLTNSDLIILLELTRTNPGLLLGFQHRALTDAIVDRWESERA